MVFFWGMGRCSFLLQTCLKNRSTDPDLDGLPRNRVQVIVTEVQFFQRQQVIECSLVDQHQLVVVEDEVVKLRHAAEGVVADPRQSVTKTETAWIREDFIQ